MKYTIVEPGFEYIDRHQEGYLKFLERCARTCYKSEKHISEGSSERLLNKIVKKYKHISVIEHESCIIDIVGTEWLNILLIAILKQVPLFSHRFSIEDDGCGNYCLRLSGNIRMWLELKDKWGCFHFSMFQNILHERWPFFFDGNDDNDLIPRDVKIELVDDNPVTNKNKLHQSEMEKHMTLTYKLIGSRSMSHQLVRHRLFSFSQESMRYCNYDKKGLQVVKPPTEPEQNNTYISCQRTITINKCRNTYSEFIKRGIKPENARMLLPICSKTEVVTTGTIKNWKHVFEHRANNPQAQWEIRDITQGIQKHARALLPNVF